MKNTFFNISDEKQKRLIDACLTEFSINGYTSSSINSIIKTAKISKGGLFKYIESKEDLYLFVIRKIMSELILYQSKKMDLSSNCLFDRIESLLNIGFEFYRNNEIQFKVVLIALSDYLSPVHKEVLDMKEKLILEYQSKLLSGIDWSLYSKDKKDVLKITNFMLEGHDSILLKSINRNRSIELVQEEMLMNIKLITQVLKDGLKGE